MGVPPIDDDAPTNYAPTELGAVPEETEAHTAWSLEPPEPEHEPRWSARRITVAALAGSLALLAGTAGLAIWQLRQPAVFEVVATEPVIGMTPATTMGMLPPFDPETGFPDPPPPPTETVTVERPAPVEPVANPATELDPYDALLLQRLRMQTWVIYDPYAVTANAWRVCEALRQGYPSGDVASTLAAMGVYTLADARTLVATAMGVYPGCP